MGLREFRTRGWLAVIDCGGPMISISNLEPWLLRIRVSPEGSFRPHRSWSVIPDDNSWSRPQLEAQLADGALQVGCGDLAVRLSELDGRIDVSDARGSSLLSGGRLQWDDRGDIVRSIFALPKERRFFGCGERTGPLNKRGYRYTCWTTDEWRRQDDETDSLYVAIPYVLISDEGGEAFGLFLNSTFRSSFDMGRTHPGHFAIETAGGELDLFVLAGPRPADVVSRLVTLTGRSAMPPRWVLGHHQARWSYGSSDEVLGVARELRSRRIPTDSIHLDIDHMDGYRVFTWDRRHFPNPRALADELRRDNLRLTVVVDAAVKRDPGYDVYDAGVAGRRFLEDRHGEPITGFVWPGKSVLPDHARTDVRLWWSQLYRRYLESGVAGFLNDMNEPALHDRPMDDPRSANVEPPPDAVMGPPGEEATHAELRNMYALLENRGVAEWLHEADPEARGLLITRSGFAGIQRYAVVWTGDNVSSWEHLAMSVPQLLNLGLSGVAMAGADIGGFFGDCDSELLVRWMQLGAVYPFARNNSADGTSRQEPWARGPEVEAAYRRAVELRYRLLPYLYTTLREAVRTGAPILRPLFLEYPDDRWSYQVEDQLLLGRDLLVAPILGPGQSGREVYLPPGDWYAFTGGSRHEGPGTISASCGLDAELPIFARAGAVIPTREVTQSTEDSGAGMTFHAYADANGKAKGILYEDDGWSTAHERGEWCETAIELRPDALTGHRSGRYKPPQRPMSVAIVSQWGREFADVPATSSWKISRRGP
jgi:alpha-glucosidase